MPVSSYELSNEVENREEDLSYIFESIYFEIVEQFHPDKEEYIYIYIYINFRGGEFRLTKQVISSLDAWFL